MCGGPAGLTDWLSDFTEIQNSRPCFTRLSQDRAGGGRREEGEAGGWGGEGCAKEGTIVSIPDRACVG